MCDSIRIEFMPSTVENHSDLALVRKARWYRSALSARAVMANLDSALFREDFHIAGRQISGGVHIRGIGVEQATSESRCENY